MGAPARKGGKEHEAPCMPKLEAYLDAYITTAGIADDKDGPLFRTTGRFTGTPHRSCYAASRSISLAVFDCTLECVDHR
jgi:hypothetical protein